MNRTLTHAADGSVVLRPDRVIRAVLVVAGQCALEQLEDELISQGFARGMLNLGPPDDWRSIQPADWPDEPAIPLAVDECLVRLMGPFRGAPAAFPPDMAIADSGATYSIAQAWEYVQAIGESAGAVAPKPAAKPAAAGDHTGVLVLTAGALFGLGFWMNWRNEQRAAREQQRMLAVIERDERSAVDARVSELEAEGRSREEALAIVSSEIEPESIAIAAIEDVT